MTRYGRSVVFTAPGIPLECREEVIPDPEADHVLIRVQYAGVCGSDVHRLAGDLPSPPVPVCFGHEAVGIVEAVGSGATVDHNGRPLAVGDAVYWFPAAEGAPCGRCDACVAGRSIVFCDKYVWPIPATEPNSAGFREYATVGMRAPIYRVPEGTSPESVIAFGCAMPTAIGGMARLGDVKGQNLVIQGCGPVGLACTVLASIAGAAHIIVIGEPEQRLSFARALGATETIRLTATTREERLERIQAMTGGGADAVIEAAGQVAAFPEGLDLLGNDGRYLILGLYSGTAGASINPVRINNLSLTVMGYLGNPVANFGRAVEVATEYGERYAFADLITHRFALEETEAAIAATGRGEAVKSVVVPGSRGI